MQRCTESVKAVQLKSSGQYGIGALARPIHRCDVSVGSDITDVRYPLTIYIGYFWITSGKSWEMA